MCISVFQGIISVVGVKLFFCFVVAAAVFKTIELFYSVCIQIISSLAKTPF